MKKKLVIVFVCIFALLNINVSAEEVVVLESKLTAKKTEIAAKEAEIKELENTKKDLKNSILDINDGLKEVQTQLDDLSEKVETITKELDSAQAIEDEKKEIFYKRLIVLYEKGNVAYIETFLESKNIMDMSKRTEYIKQISENDKKIFNEFATATQKVEERKKELDDASAEFQRQKDEFDRQINSASEEIADIDAKIKTHKEQLNQFNTEKDDIEKQLYKKTYAGRLFAEGEKYLGYPYVWGGSTPETSFDCSGFVCWTYTHSGVYNLPRTTAQQIYNQCKKISPAEARPGDLFFYGNGSTINHVAIYIGNGQVVHASSPSSGIKISSAFYRTPLKVVNILGN